MFTRWTGLPLLLQLSESARSSTSESTDFSAAIGWQESQSRQNVTARFGSVSPTEPIWGGEGVAAIGVDDDVDEAIDSVAWGRGGSGKRRTPSRVAWKWKSPNVRFTPSWRASKAGLKAGRCGTKLSDPKNIGSAGVVEL